MTAEKQRSLEARNIAVNCWSREGSINTSFNLLRGLPDRKRKVLEIPGLKQSMTILI